MKVRIYPVSPDAWRESPADVAELVAKRIAEEPDALWLVAVGSPADLEHFSGRELVLNHLDDLKVVFDVGAGGQAITAARGLIRQRRG